MNVHALLSRTAAAHAGILDRRATERRRVAEAEALERARAQWLNALLVDQTRAWLSLGEEDRGVLTGLCTVLAMAGMVHTYETRTVETVELRIIRGAISAAEQAGNAGSVITVDTANAFRSACMHAEAILRAASHAAIAHAALAMRRELGMPTA